MSTTIFYVLLTAIRDWLFLGIFGVVILAIGVSSFLGDTAFVEKSDMVLSYASTSTRIIILTGLIVFVCFHVRNAFQNREIDLIISRPISRTQFLISYWLGFVLIAVLLIIPIAGVLLFWQPDTQGLLYWAMSMILESIFVIAIALCSSLILRSASAAVLFCFTFYFMSRMIGFFLYVISSPYTFSEVNLNYLTGHVLTYISVLLPRLDLFGQSSWLISGIENLSNPYFIIVQTIFYVPLLLAMANFDFKRKQF